MIRLVALSAILMGVVSCANPLNRATYDRYWDQGLAAERSGQLAVAEQAYYRALVNVDMGNLGSLLKAQALYNLGRIKRMLAKFGESEDLLKQSLTLDEKILKSGDLDSDRCRAELAVALAAQDKWEEGSRYLESILPNADRFSGGEREFLIEVFHMYAEELRKRGCEERARLFMLPKVGSNKTKPNQALERNAYVRHAACGARVAPATGVAHL
jgi:tetratricopeptide (TPR) repeat protein